MNFTYYMPVRILFGRGQLNQLHQQKLPGRKALVVISSGKSTVANGYLARLEKQLDLAGVEHVLFDQIVPNPIKRHVMEGAALAKAAGCDFVVGLGGGSPIDAAKAIAVMARNEGDYWDYIHGGSGKGLPVRHAPLPVVAITTTAGTGTEADPWTVTTHEGTQEKIGFGFDGTFPVLSLVDPELMLTVPPQFTAFQGFDALFHSTEGYIHKGANTMSDINALKAIELLGAWLPKAVRDGSDLDAREQVAMANTLAGFVESTSGCTSEHSIEHALSADHPELPHGAGLIMLSKAYFSHFAASGACDRRLVDMAKALGKADATRPADFVEALVDLQRQCGVAALRMSDYGIKREELPALARKARETMGGLFAVDPAPLSDADVVAILEASYR
jgi:alcohol dehydrogenase